MTNSQSLELKFTQYDNLYTCHIYIVTVCDIDRISPHLIKQVYFYIHTISINKVNK